MIKHTNAILLALNVAAVSISPKKIHTLYFLGSTKSIDVNPAKIEEVNAGCENREKAPIPNLAYNLSANSIFPKNFSL